MVQQDRAAEYIDSPMMTQRLRFKKQLSAQIDGTYGTYRTQYRSSSRLAILHDGEIEVQSTPGRGTTFRLLLPQA